MKKRRMLVRKKLKKLIESRPEYYIWDAHEIIAELNKMPPKQYKLSNSNELTKLFQGFKGYHIFKRDADGRYEYIFVKSQYQKLTKKLKFS